MKIYLAGSIAGGREFAKQIALISQCLEGMGHDVLTKNNVVQTKDLNKYHDNLKNRKLIFNRDKKWILNCDAVVMEVSVYSHGVGYEHAIAEIAGKPVLILRHDSLKKNRYSAFLDGTGYAKLTFSFYNEKNVREILNKFFEKLSG